MTLTATDLDFQRPLDLICMGRVAVDFYAEQIGSPLEDAQSFRKYLGGCAGNISVGTSRLGLKSSMFSRVGSDDMGKFLTQTLNREGVDTSRLIVDSDHLTGLVILGVDPPDRFPLIFYRKQCADMQMDPVDIDPTYIGSSKALLVTGTGFSQPGMYAASLQAIMTAHTQKTAVILDIDYRPVLWGLTSPGDGESRYYDSEPVTATYQKILPYIDLIVGTEEEIHIAGGGATPQDALSRIRQVSSAPIVMKKGALGCEVHLASGEVVECKPFPVEVFNVLGAGDAFMSGFLRGWLTGKAWRDCGQYGNANGAIVVSRHGCAPAMANFEELQHFINTYHKDSDVLDSPALATLHRQSVLGAPQQKELLILAHDHRVQFEQSCELLNQDPSLIADFKQLIHQGFQKVWNQFPHRGLALLVDPQYGMETLKTSAYQSYTIGVPIEAAGSFPVQWLSSKNLYSELLERPSSWFVKVLWHFHNDLSEDLKTVQLQQLKQLHEVCVSLDRKLMLELIIPGKFPINGNSLSGAIRTVYEEDVYPYWWKIPPVDSSDEWQLITKAVDAFDPHCGIVLLGQNASMDRFQAWFSIARQTPHTVGFAIGRTIFWQLWEQFAQGKIESEAVQEEIARRYEELIQVWDASRSNTTES